MDEVKILDHGYLRLIEKWGSDERIIESARMSTDKGFQGWGREPEFVCSVCGYILACSLVSKNIEKVFCPNTHVADFTDPNHHTVLTYVEYPKGDEKLLKYLYTHKHMTPFEMGGLIIEVQAPIFVFREWHRHRTQSYNELSGRYSVLPDMYYVPALERIQKNSTTNKQGSGVPFSPVEQQQIQDMIRGSQYGARHMYDELIRLNVAREIARVVVPVAQYSRMRASANLRNWLQFLTLRLDPGAQWEIRQYAQVLGDVIQAVFPRTWELFSAPGTFSKT